MFGPDVVVTEVACFLEREFNNLLRARGERDLHRGLHCGARLDDLLDLATDLLEIDRHGLEDIGGDALALLDEAEQDVLGTDVLVVEALRLAAGEAHDLAGAFSEAVEHVKRDLRRSIGLSVGLG